jgi:GTP-binding protein
MSSRPPVRASASRKVPQTAKPISKAAASSDAVQLGSANAAPFTPTSAPSRLPDKAVGMPALVTPMGWMHTARFLTTAAQLHHLPDMDTPEIAFVGRSNAGKSTCINTLTQKKQLAFASKKPGRTQHINLFALGKQGITDTVLADLPGYGYAAVAKMDKLRWQQVMANYLVSRENLTGIVMMCDPRHGLTELDDILLEVIRPRVEEGLKFLIILTKADKLTRAEQAKALSIARLQAGGGEVKLFSALKKQGVDEVAQLLWDWTHPAAGAMPAPQLAEPIEEEPEALDE